MKNRYPIYLLIIFVLFISCEKEIKNFDLKKAEKKIVINGVINSGDSIIVNVSKSLDIKDNYEAVYLENATVRVFENNEFIENLDYIIDGYYKSASLIPRDNNIYTIRVEAEDFKITSGQCIIPQSPIVSGLQYSVQINEDKSAELTIKLKFIDNKKTSNYYSLFIKSTDLNLFPEINKIVIGFKCNENIVEFMISKNMVIDYFDSEYDQDYEGIVFSDLLIDGKEYEITLKINMNVYYGHNSRYYIEFCSISKDYYRFYKTLAQYSKDVTIPLIDNEVQVYTNIENGLGLLGAQSTEVDSFDIIH